MYNTQGVRTRQPHYRSTYVELDGGVELGLGGRGVELGLGGGVELGLSGGVELGLGGGGVELRLGGGGMELGDGVELGLGGGVELGLCGGGVELGLGGRGVELGLGGGGNRSGARRRSGPQRNSTAECAERSSGSAAEGSIHGNLITYSSDLKSVIGVSQVQLNYLATASDLGKAPEWSSAVALMWLSLWAVMFAAAAMGLVGYGAQWLVI